MRNVKFVQVCMAVGLLFLPFVVHAQLLKGKVKGQVDELQVMTAPDGRVVRLSELFGKFLYIDVWATWCGPCCAEISHLEKLVERFAGNDKVRFVSISSDATE